MACMACWQQRQVFYGAVRQGNPYAMARAVTRGVMIATDKLRGVDVDRKYAVSDPRLPFRLSRPQVR